jgi:uncharacterized protein YndB with AHSA1/START domain
MSSGMSYAARLGAIVVLSACAVVTARAEVVDAERAGFTTRTSLVIDAPRLEVWRAATDRLQDWWLDDHSITGSAANLRLEAVPQGCLCERLPDGGGVVHLTVTFVSPGVMLRLTGTLGPLGLLGTSGNLVWEFEDADAGTRVTWTYVVGGYAPEGLAGMAPAVDRMLASQLQELKEFVEQGHTG